MNRSGSGPPSMMRPPFTIHIAPPSMAATPPTRIRLGDLIYNLSASNARRLLGRFVTVGPERVALRHPREPERYGHQRLRVLIVEPEHSQGATMSNTADQRGNILARRTAIRKSR